MQMEKIIKDTIHANGIDIGAHMCHALLVS